MTFYSLEVSYYIDYGKLNDGPQSTQLWAVVIHPGWDVLVGIASWAIHAPVSDPSLLLGKHSRLIGSVSPALVESYLGCWSYSVRRVERLCLPREGVPTTDSTTLFSLYQFEGKEDLEQWWTSWILNLCLRCFGEIFQMSVDNLCLILACFSLVVKHWPKTNWWEKDLFQLWVMCSPSVREAQQRKAEPWWNALLMASSSWPSQITFLFYPRPPALQRRCPQRARHSHTPIINQESAPWA